MGEASKADAEVNEIHSLLRQWEEEHSSPSYNPVATLTRMSQIIEVEIENYMKMDPDPFDERHPSRAYPDCALGQMLKIIFKKDTFKDKLVSDYLRENGHWSRSVEFDVREVNTAAARLTLNIMPGYDTLVLFKDTEGLIFQLFAQAERGVEPLRTYATGLLAHAMEIEELAASFREQNAHLVPIMLQRLHALQKEAMCENEQLYGSNRPFAHFNKKLSSTNKDSLKKDKNKGKSSIKRKREPSPEFTISSNERVQLNGTENGDSVVKNSPLKHSPRKKFAGSAAFGVRRQLSFSDSENFSPADKDSLLMAAPSILPNSSVLLSPKHGPSINECSNSSWVEMESFLIGSFQMFPPTLSTKQILIFRYLAPLGQYQELLGHVFEQDALRLILHCINFRKSKDARLAFDALKYLVALLHHKKFAIEFINVDGLQYLLNVPRPSIAATGVSLCLYYLAPHEDTMERICFLPKQVLTDLVKYALWLLECSHNSGQCHATMFFRHTLQFRVILDLFDAHDGLRKLYNVVSTLPILTTDDALGMRNEDEEFVARQAVHYVCGTLKRYFEVHLTLKAEQLRRQHFRELTGPVIPPYKAVKTAPEKVREDVALLLELMPFGMRWPPVSDFLNLGGVNMLLQATALAYEWNYSGRSETVRFALDALAVCSAVPAVQLLLCDKLELPDDSFTAGWNVILGAAEGEIAADPEVQRAALNVIINCAAAPVRPADSHSGKGHLPVSGSKKRSIRSNEDLINKVWECIRANNGIMVLLQLMTVKVPITDADSIRAAACCALAGLARSETVCQIVGKLPLFTNGQLQILMREPILQDKRQDHVTFQKYALDLLARVSGKSKSSVGELEVSLSRIQRASVVAQTRIQYNGKQLLQLMYQHLLSVGLEDVASLLQKKAGLSSVPPKPAFGTIPSLFRQARSSPACRSPIPTSPVARPSLTACSSTSNTVPAITPVSVNSCPNYSVTPSVPSSSSNVPLRLHFNSNRKNDKTPSLSVSRSLQKQISYDSFSPAGKTTIVEKVNNPSVTLDTIVTEYLMNQHTLCKNPMITCPQFDLFTPHKCPDPKIKNTAATNIAVRISHRSSVPFFGGVDGCKLNRKLLYSRFRPVKTFRQTSEDSFITCCSFSPCEKYMIAGTYNGDIKLFNLHTATEEATYQCTDSYISNIEPNRTGDLLLMSSLWRRPLSSLWKFSNFFDMQYAFESEEHVEFSKLNQERIVGTNAEIATIYDVATGTKLMTLQPQSYNQYTKNHATFNPTDELVLCDGVLWDVTSGKQIHKFDKLNQTLSGVFHPNGLEIVSNAEVWDLRTFHLLKTVPSLNQCQVTFSNVGNVIYGMMVEQETDMEASYDSSFKTLDALDYSSIATIDVKRQVYSLATNKHDTQLAVVENLCEDDTVDESSIRLYDIGRLRDDDDEIEEDEEDEEEEDDDGNSDTDDDDDGDDLAFSDDLIEEVENALNDYVAENGEDEDNVEDSDAQASDSSNEESSSDEASVENDEEVIQSSSEEEGDDNNDEDENGGEDEDDDDDDDDSEARFSLSTW